MTIKSQRLLARAKKNANQGEVEEARKLYAKVLELSPSNQEAQDGLLEFQPKDQSVPPKSEIQSAITLFSNGQIQEALDIVETLIKDYPEVPLLFNISGACYAGLGQFDRAVMLYEQALTIEPEYAEAHYNLASTLQELGQLDAAVKSYDKSLAIKPNYADAHNNLGNVLKDLKQLEAAVKSYKTAIAIKPDYLEAHYSLGTTLQELGQLDDAVKSYKEVLDIEPDFAEMHNNLGVIFKELNQKDAARKSLERAVAIKPDFVEAHNNLGNILKELDQLNASVKCYEQAVALKPDYADAHYNLGGAFKDLDQLEAAVKSYERSLAIHPEYADAHYNLGGVFKDLGQLEAAVKSYKKVIVLKPDYAEAYNNLGSALKELGQLDTAIKYYDRAMELKSDIYFTFGESLHTKMQLCIWDDLSSQLDELTNKINNSEKVINPFPLLALIDDPELHMKTAKILVSEKFPQSHVLSKIERYPKHKKIRIGYFSADFRNHPVSTLKTDLYELHDRSQFEIYAFSYGPDTKDEMNLRIKAGVDHFHDVHMMLDKDLAILSRSLEIDIAVDLGGFTQDSRTGLFAIRAAPIQVNYLGYPGTMAANYMDYLIADSTLIPEEKKHHYLEKIVYMPNSFMVNDTKTKLSNRVFTKVETGLPANGFVFCCFNNHYKITPNIFIGWMRILKAVEGSVLWLTDGNSTANINLQKEAKKNGVDENRLIFAPRLDSMKDHLNRIQLSDLFIDTLPYNAHATSSDALRMGLPVLTCVGNSFASRVAASLLNAVNLPELITTTQEQYESLAIQLATHPEKLKIIKDKLVNNLPTAPLYDTPLFTQQLESAYLTMYERYQQGLDPDYIYVKH